MNPVKKIAVLLSGCGNMDGSEIHESILSLLEIANAGYDYDCFSLDQDHTVIVNHFSQEEEPLPRNILHESARIARGQDIHPMQKLEAEGYAGLWMPGGYGIAHNFSNFHIEGENMTINSQVNRVITEFYKAKKPICALCIAPILVAKAINGVKITLGNNPEVTTAASKMGAKCEITNTNLPIVDSTNKIVTLPCYMLKLKINQIHDGIKAAANEFFKLIQ